MRKCLLYIIALQVADFKDHLISDLLFIEDDQNTFV